MKKTIYYVTLSLDGFIARKNGSIDWLLQAQGEDFGYADFLETIDTVVMGRRTYEQVLTFGEYPYRDKKSFVFSRTLRTAEHAEIVSSPVETFVSEQKLQTGRDIWLVGGGALAGRFFQANAVDEVRAFVQPILLGEGIPLAGHPGGDVRLHLTHSEVYEQGLIRLDYQVLR